MPIRIATLILATTLGLRPAAASAETCRFAGTTTHDGHVTASTDVTETAGLLTINVTVAFTISAWLSDARYLSQEITTWRANELQGIALNNRTIVDGQVRRQQWDVWSRTPAGLLARRVQAKTLDDFRAHHPAFVRHWSPAGFGQAWLPDYDAATPVRRPDLDLPANALPAGLRTPLALAFYWSRYLPPSGGGAPILLPGFKHDARTEVTFGPATPGDGWHRWSAPLRHPALDSGLAAAWVSSDGYLLQLGLEARSSLGSGQALIRTQGCQGVQIVPGR